MPTLATLPNNPPAPPLFLKDNRRKNSSSNPFEENGRCSRPDPRLGFHQRGNRSQRLWGYLLRACERESRSKVAPLARHLSPLFVRSMCCCAALLFSRAACCKLLCSHPTRKPFRCRAAVEIRRRRSRVASRTPAWGVIVQSACTQVHMYPFQVHAIVRPDAAES